MLPVILSFGPVVIYSFGLMLFLAVVLGLFVSWKKIDEYHIEDAEFFDTALWVIFWGLVGARALYIVEHFGSFGLSPLKWVWFTHYVGLSMWGAAIGGFACLWIVSLRNKRETFDWLDIGALGVALGLSVGRIGSWLNGGSGFPIQMLEALAMFFVFVALWRLEPEYRTLSWYRAGRNSARSGFLFFSLLLLLGLVFLSSSFGYSKPGSELLLSRLLAGVSLVMGVVGLYMRSGRSRVGELRFMLNLRK